MKPLLLLCKLAHPPNPLVFGCFNLLTDFSGLLTWLSNFLMMLDVSQFCHLMYKHFSYIFFDPIYYCLFNFYHLQNLFGLPCSTTCDSFKPHKNLQPGYNQDIIDHAVVLYEGGPVTDASDEARALRFVKIINTIVNFNPRHKSQDTSPFCWKMIFVYTSPSPLPTVC